MKGDDMTEDYSKMTQDEFDEILLEIMMGMPFIKIADMVLSITINHTTMIGLINMTLCLHMALV